jgi:hypothetical protein
MRVSVFALKVSVIYVGLVTDGSYYVSSNPPQLLNVSLLAEKVGLGINKFVIS